MNKYLSLVCFLLSVVICNAQTFPASINPSTAEDYVVLLQKCGYMSYSADISVLLKEKDIFWIEPVIRHYKNGELQENTFDFGVKFSNRDSKTMCDNVRVGFAPDTNKMFRYLNFYVTETGAISMPLIFDEQNNPETGESSNTYGYCQFSVDNITLNTFIPIAMCGTYWYDKDLEGFRFCGEDVLNPNMSADILKMIPEYYLIGMEISK